MTRYGIWFTLALFLPASTSAQANSDHEFRWEGPLARGRWLIVANLNGSVSVEPASGHRVEIVAKKYWQRGDPNRVRIELRRSGPQDGDVRVCALWDDGASCDERGRWQAGHRERNAGDVSVEFTVRLPQGVNVRLSTVNGRISVRGASGEIAASSVNGGLSIATTAGPVSATTVNGDVQVELSRVGPEDLRCETVNGSVELRLPEGVDAELSVRTVNGSIESDFPLPLRGRITPRQLDATLGRGGPRLMLATVNGSVRLERR